MNRAALRQSGVARAYLGPVRLVGTIVTVNENASPLPGYQPGAAAHARELTMAPPGPTSVALGFDSLTEPVFPPAAWLEETGLADHPLLRGLLLELPPKGSAPSPEWLNRWFEAARAILELLYVR